MIMCIQYNEWPTLRGINPLLQFYIHFHHYHAVIGIPFNQWKIVRGITRRSFFDHTIEEKICN